MSYGQLFLDKGESLFFNNVALGRSHTHEYTAAQTRQVSLKETTNEDLKLGGK